MIPSDILLIASLFVFVFAWWRRGMERRELILRVALVVALLASCWGLYLDRWQAGLGGLIALGLLLVVFFRRPPSPDLKKLPVISGSVFAVLAVLAFGLIYLFPIRDLPKPEGPHSVGVLSFELQDQSRKGLFAAGPDEPRRLLVRAWYPAEPGELGRRAKYFSRDEAKSTARGIGSQLGFPPLLAFARNVKTNSHLDSRPLSSPDPFPTVIFSHGYGAFSQQNTALMEHLASHGYAVYSIQHTYDSSPTAFPGGDVVDVDPALLDDINAEQPPEFSFESNAGERLAARLAVQEFNIERQTRILKLSTPIWLQDQVFVVDQLEAGSVPETARSLVAKSRFDRIGVVGMSFGGSTAGGFCFEDDRCAAGANMDGLDFHFQPLDQRMPVPFLMLHSDMSLFGEFFDAPEGAGTYAFNEFSYASFDDIGTPNDAVRLQVKDLMHMGFSDFSLFMRRPLRNPLLGAAPSDAIIEIQNDVMLDFLDQTLRSTNRRFPDDVLGEHVDLLLPLDSPTISDWWSALSQEGRDDVRREIAALKARQAEVEVTAR